MWIPYDLRGLLVAEPRGAAARLSEADTSLRPFFVGVWLKNPVTQHWETDLSLPGDIQPLVSAGPHGPAEITFHANDTGRLSEVIAQLDAHSPAEAVEICLMLLQPVLLTLSARVGRGIAPAAWQVMDLRHEQRFRASPNRPSTLDAQSTWFTSAPPPDLLPAMQLCQRSRAASDAPGRLLAAASALSHMLQSKAFAAAQASALTLSPQMLLHGGTFGQCQDLQGLTYDSFLARLRPVLAGLMQPDGLWAALPSDQADTPRLTALANLADLAAHRMILTELHAREQQVQALTEPVG